MLFNSINYFLFLGAVFILNYIIPNRFRWALLLIASIFFYVVSSAATFAVPVIIVLVTFLCGLMMGRKPKAGKKTYFWIGILVNLGLLIFLKYINFFIAVAIDSFISIKHLFGQQAAENHSSVFLDLIVPLGISYITFQAIGYLIEINRGSHKPEKNFVVFSAYLLFFPKLLSGPIERAHNFLPQLRQNHELNYEQVSSGLKRILWGLFLKLVVANRLALYTDAVFSNSENHSGITLLLASLFFSIQLFADFAGYTEVAIGSAQLLGYKLMENFDRPFIATTVTEFWRRWHMSLTTWVNDYIFNPLVIAWRNWNKWAVVSAGMVTFLILGFWHGASWNYIIFGFLQGLILAIEFLTRKTRKKLRNSIPSWVDIVTGMIFVYLYFSFSVIFFKVETTHDAFSIIAKIFTFKGPLFVDSPATIIFSLLGIFVIAVEGLINKSQSERFTFLKSPVIRKLSYAFIVIVILLIGVFDGGQFIYFKF